ncbi:MAG: hypothetical protein JXO51_07700 [Candidatus Aminicenantes bacterium]|nr:hypothetical protein [Candidatus Aminicenantes bacterium]
MSNKFVLFFAALLMSALAFSHTVQRANYLPLVQKRQDRVLIAIKPLQASGTYFLHYRTEGMENFQVRKMRADASGMISYLLETENLYGRHIEYYVVEERAEGEAVVSLTHTIGDFTHRDSPEIYFQDGGQPSASARKREPFLNASGSLSTSTKISDNSEYPGQNYTANGNLRIYRNITDNEYQFDFDTNFNHVDPRNQDSESRINLSSMMIRFKRGSLQFEVGDVAVNETEYTTSYLNRRGLRFEVSDQNLYVNAFYTNSQQKTGFDGYGIPDSKAGIYGTVLGFNLKNTAKLRGMFMAGKDNLDSKTLYSSENPNREGNIFSLWGEVNLLRNRLQLSGEVSSCQFGAAQLEEELEKEGDTAWKAGLKYNQGIVSFTADYEDIGDHFNSIANLFLQNDRKGFNTTLGLNIKAFSWNASYLDKKNYIHSLLQDALHQRRASTSFNWGIDRHFRLGAEVALDNLDYDSSTGLQTSSSDMSTYTYSGSLGYIAGSTGVNLQLGNTRSVNFSSNLNASLGLNLRFGKFMTLNPTFSFQENKNLADGGKSTVANIYLNSEVTFIPEYCSLTVSASYMNNEGEYSTSSSWSAGANLNFFMAKLFKEKVRPSLSLKSLFQGANYGETKTDSAIFSLQADIAF